MREHQAALRARHGCDARRQPARLEALAGVRVGDEQREGIAHLLAVRNLSTLTKFDWHPRASKRSSRGRKECTRWQGPQCLFVGDAKYERIEYEGFHDGDLYQMTAHAIAADLPRGIHVYAAGESEPFIHRIVTIGRRSRSSPRTSRVPPELVLDQIMGLADRIRASCRRQLAA